MGTVVGEHTPSNEELKVVAAWLPPVFREAEARQQRATAL
jgi:hypothetical protein